MAGNFYILVRGWMDSDVFEDEPYTEREAFLYLIEKAAWKDRPFRVGKKIIQLKRGQLTASLRYLAEAWKWDKNRVSKFLTIMSDVDMVRTDAGTGQNILTICNYSKYQDVKSISGTDVGQDQGQMWDRSGTDVGQKRDKTNKDNKDNKDNQLIARGDDFLQKCLEAAEINLERNPNQKITRQCEEFSAKWKVKGLDFVLPNIRKIVDDFKDQGKRPPATLKYYQKGLAEKLTKAQPAGDWEDTEAAQCRVRIQAWQKPNGDKPGRWREDMWGPPPDHPHTRVPPKILAEFGVVNATKGNKG